MDVAELYLSMTRPSAVPVVGECMADGFVGQIQIERWSWNLMNDDEIKRAEEDQKDYDSHAEFLKTQPNAGLRKQLLELNKKKAAKSRAESRLSEQESFERQEKELLAQPAGADRDRKLRELRDKHKTAMRKSLQDEAREQAKYALQAKGLDRALTRQERKMLEELGQEVEEATDEINQKMIDDADAAYAKRNKSYEFNFSKRVDFATTQMLNSMKAGDVFPLAVLTINQRSSNSGMVLVFTVTNLRLLDYSLRAEVSETMTDMKEQWKAEFRSLAYVYKNRKAIESSTDGAEAATKMATQGTVRTFAMKKDLGI